MPRQRISRRGQGIIYLPRYTYKGRVVVSKVWWIQYFDRGKRKRESTGTSDRSVAQEKLREKVSDVHNHDTVNESATYEDLEKRIVENYEKKGRNLRVLNNSRLPPLRRHFGGMLARDIDEQRILRYASARRKEKKMVGGNHPKQSKDCVSGPTVNRELAVLRRMLNLAYRARMLRRVPAFEMFAESPARKGFLDAHHVEKLKQHCPHETYRNLLDIMFITGWRVSSELLTRTWADVDFVGNELRLWVGQGKDRKVGRVFKLLPTLRAAIDRQREHVRSLERIYGKKIPWVFVKNDGGQLRAPRTGIMAIFARAGLAGILPHDFRRSAVRSLNKARVDRHTAKSMVGHKTDSMYGRYSIVDEEMMDTAANQLEAFLAGEQKSIKEAEARRHKAVA